MISTEELQRISKAQDQIGSPMAEMAAELLRFRAMVEESWKGAPRLSVARKIAWLYYDALEIEDMRTQGMDLSDLEFKDN